MVVMMEGALGESMPQSTVHLKNIKKSMYPNSSSMKASWGTNSKKKSTQRLKWILLVALMKMPRVMCATPRITEIFIFKELTKLRLFSATDHTGSSPNG